MERAQDCGGVDVFEWAHRGQHVGGLALSVMGLGGQAGKKWDQWEVPRSVGKMPFVRLSGFLF